MADSSTGVHAFLEQLREDLTRIAKELHLDLSKNEHAGYAFSTWYAQLLANSDASLPDDIVDNVMRGGSDLGIDVVLPDDANKTIVLAQTKFRGHGRAQKDQNPAEVEAFLRKHDQLQDHSFIGKGSKQARELLGPYTHYLKNGWKAKFHFVTTAVASDRCHEDVQRRNTELAAKDLDVTYALIDRDGLRAAYDRAQSLDAAIPESVEIDLPDGQFVEVPGPMRCVLAVLKGNELRNQYLRQNRRESLFAWNIRNYLGDRGINHQIKDTAQTRPDHFFYFNNGITAICHSFDIDGNHITIRKFQIINGAQTVGSIAAAAPNEDVRVLFRLVQTGTVTTDHGVNSDIISANNTQNRIEVSDFRANDAIQSWLHTQIGKFPETPVLGRIAYKPKRSGKRIRNVSRVVELEELAKIRYAYVADPCEVHADPKSLWTPRSRGGRYETAFGVDGYLKSNWTNEILREAMLAVAFHDAAKDSAKLERERDEVVSYMYRLRFHAVALAGILMRELPASPSPQVLLQDRDKFDAFWTTVWDEARKLFFGFHAEFVERDDGTLFALVRSPEQWRRMQKGFRFAFKLTMPKQPEALDS